MISPRKKSPHIAGTPVSNRARLANLLHKMLLSARATSSLKRRRKPLQAS